MFFRACRDLIAKLCSFNVQQRKYSCQKSSMSMQEILRTWVGGGVIFWGLGSVFLGRALLLHAQVLRCNRKFLISIEKHL